MWKYQLRDVLVTLCMVMTTLPVKRANLKQNWETWNNMQSVHNTSCFDSTRILPPVESLSVCRNKSRKQYSDMKLRLRVALIV